MKLFTLSLVLIISHIAPSKAYSDGALPESCFDHYLNHTAETAPTVYEDALFLECDAPCVFNVEVTGMRNDSTGEYYPIGPFGNETTFTYKANTTYRGTCNTTASTCIHVTFLGRA